MTLPDFFNQAPKITLRDPLAQFLGATPDGMLTYAYEDAVKLCGHSCPTVAGAYLMVLKGVQALYPNEIPERGNIEVAMRGGRSEGTVGVTASVAQLITGAAPETGRPERTLFPPRFVKLRCGNRRRNLPAPPRYGRKRARVIQRQNRTVRPRNARNHAAGGERSGNGGAAGTVRRTVAATRPHYLD